MAKSFHLKTGYHMGLDAIEIVMEIEKAFHISIPDQEAEKVFTVGDLYNCVWRHIQHRQTNLCKTQVIFYRLRKYAVQQLGFSAQQFLPSTNPNEVVPVAERRFQYLQMENALQWELPPLGYPPALDKRLQTIALLLLTVAVAVLVYLIFFLDYSSWLFALLIPLLLLIGFIDQQLSRFKVHITSDTVRSLTERIFTTNYRNEEGTQTISRKETELLVKQIIIDKIGVDEEEVVLNASLTDDLGIN